MNKKNITIIILTALVGLSSGFVYNKNANKVENSVVNNTQTEQVEIGEIESIKDSLPDIDIAVDTVELKKASFGFKLEDGSDELEFGTPWKVNAKGDMSLAIEGRGPEAIEEGFGFVCLKKDNKTQYIFIDDETAGISPKYVEWYDDENFVIYMVGSYGRVFAGGTLYMVNVNDMVPKILYVAGENEEISEATQIDADIINMKILEYKNEGEVSVEKNIKFK